MVRLYQRHNCTMGTEKAGYVLKAKGNAMFQLLKWVWKNLEGCRKR